MEQKNRFELVFEAKQALFTDPISKTSGERWSYPIPTYEALKAMYKAVYWKPTFIWVIDRVKVCNPIFTESINMKNVGYAKAILNINTRLTNVRYAVSAHIEWNNNQTELIHDQCLKKHGEMFNRTVEKHGSRLRIFAGVKECEAHAIKANFNDEQSVYQNIPNVDFGNMFHGFSYPDETGKTNKDGKPDPNGTYQLVSRFFNPTMHNGIVEFPHPNDCTTLKVIHAMQPKFFKNK